MSDTTINVNQNMNNKDESVQDDILRDLDLNKTEEKLESKQPMQKDKQTKILIALSIIAIVAGIGTGFGLNKLTAKGQPVSTGPKSSDLQQVPDSSIAVGDVFGIKDDDTFKDSAEGYLVEAVIDDEGSHKLLRPGGDSQTVFLTSSSTDLDKFVGMEVKIKGETFKGQKAGWLMDVGQVEVLVLEGEEPSEY
ncbi:MAG: hypothetical protein OEX81_05910 [Candidatus Pacebacteria bacterium]|nr:hypothetical protein [Candidatus Paceibacterota bacterium]